MRLHFRIHFPISNCLRKKNLFTIFQAFFIPGFSNYLNDCKIILLMKALKESLPNLFRLYTITEKEFSKQTLFAKNSFLWRKWATEENFSLQSFFLLFFSFFFNIESKIRKCFSRRLLFLFPGAKNAFYFFRAHKKKVFRSSSNDEEWDVWSGCKRQIWTSSKQ